MFQVINTNKYAVTIKVCNSEYINIAKYIYIYIYNFGKKNTLRIDRKE